MRNLPLFGGTAYQKARAGMETAAGPVFCAACSHACELCGSGGAL